MACLENKAYIIKMLFFPYLFDMH